MGGKTSKQQQQNYQVSTKTYSVIDHRRHHSRNHTSSVATQEIQNSNGFTSLPAFHKPVQHEEPFTPSKHNRSARKIPRHDSNIPKERLGLKKSQSTGNLINSHNFVTSRDLLFAKDKQKQRKKSSSSQISIESSQSQTVGKTGSTTNINKISSSNLDKKQMARNLQFSMIDSNDLQVNIKILNALFEEN
jgi:hypothetical protein